MNNSDLCTVVIPTFFPGKELFSNINSIPRDFRIIIVDNSYDSVLKDKISQFKNCDYFNIGDVGLGKSFNFALSKVKTPYMLLTQPDLLLRNNCIQTLILVITK